jgi:pyridoxine kinase
MAVLSIQSHVVYGYAGNTSAVFPLQRLGKEVWAVNTVEFSNHTGYGAWRGRVLEEDLVTELVLGLEERGVLPRCEAVLSGYLGSPGTGNRIMDTVRKIKSVVPGALYCCDPVMGDVGRGFYVKPGIPELFREEIIPLADMVTPNQFELEALTGLEVSSPAKAREAIDMIHARGPAVVLVTSYLGSSVQSSRPDQADHIEMLVSGKEGCFRVRTPYLPLPGGMAGSGDLTTAVFLARYLESGDIKRTLELTAASVYGILEATYKAESRELLTICSQNELVSPGASFEAFPLEL